MLAVALTATVLTVVINHTETSEFRKDLVRWVTALLLGLPLLVAATYAGEFRPSAKVWLQTAALVAIGVIGWRIGEPGNWQLLVLLLAVVLSMASTIPGIVSRSQHDWWRIHVGIFNAILLASLLTVVVHAGLWMAIASIEHLFSLKWGSAYPDVMAVCWWFVAPLAAAAQFPDSRAEFDRSLPGSAAWGRLCQFALIPLGFLFIAIISVYALRIVIWQELPDGMVALPVLALGCYGMAGRLLLEPWIEDRKWARVFARVFQVFPIFSILLFMALARRISEYGFTFERYAALALAVWINLYCILLWFRKSTPAVAAPALLAVISLIAIFGPLGARQLSLASQQTRLEALLDEPQPRSNESVRKITSSISYIATHHDLEDLEQIVGKLQIPADSGGWKKIQAARQHLQLPAVREDGAEERSFHWPQTKPMTLGGARWLHEPRSLSWNSIELGNDADGNPLSVRFRDRQLVGLVGDRIDKNFDLGSIDPSAADLESQPPTFEWVVGDRSFVILILEGEWETLPERAMQPIRLGYRVLER